MSRVGPALLLLLAVAVYVPSLGGGYVYDDPRLVSMNPAGLAMMGVDDEACVIGTDYLDAVSDADRPRVAALMERARQGDASRFNFVSVGTSGDERVFASSFAMSVV